jgi:hypothetical protein
VFGIIKIFGWSELEREFVTSNRKVFVLLVGFVLPNSLQKFTQCKFVGQIKRDREQKQTETKV